MVILKVLREPARGGTNWLDSSSVAAEASVCIVGLHAERGLRDAIPGQSSSMVRTPYSAATWFAMCRVLALERRSPGAKLTIEVRFHEGRKHSPTVTMRRAA
jgi:hypothetical protein